MLFRTGLRIPLVLALVLGFAGFFFKVPTTEALKCFKCSTYKSNPNFTEKCKNPAPGDKDFIMDCDQEELVKNFTTIKDAVVVCSTVAGKKNGEMMFQRECAMNGKEELRKCLDDYKYPPVSGCVVAAPEEFPKWLDGLTVCHDKQMKAESGEPAPGKERKGGEGSEVKLASCFCNGDLCNSITENELPDLSISGTVSSTRGSEGVIFSLTLLIHLYLQAALCFDSPV